MVLRISNMGISNMACVTRFLVRAAAAVLLCAWLIAPTHAAPPNVLFIIVDDLNTDLGAYGHPLAITPNIDRLAQGGVLFERAYSQAAVCAPSRESLLTGLYPGQNGVTDNYRHDVPHPVFYDTAPQAVSMPTWFRRNGYYTARVGKVFHQGVPAGIGQPGPDDPAAWDQAHDPAGLDVAPETVAAIHSINPDPGNRSFGGTLSWLAVDAPDSALTDGLVAGEAIRLLEEHANERSETPFFLAVGFYLPHTPLVAPGKYFDMYPLDAIKPAPVSQESIAGKPAASFNPRPFTDDMTRETRKQVIQAYYASVTYVDAQIGRVLDALARSSFADNSIVVLLSDHGFHLGRDGRWYKGDLAEHGVRIPLIIRAPGPFASGARAAAPVEALDLFPTLTELADIPAPDWLAGRSLAPMLADPDSSVRTTALTTMRSLQQVDGKWMNLVRGYTIRTQRYRYTEWADGAAGHELYDYDADPTEQKNLVLDYSDAGRRMLMRRMLLDHKRRATQNPFEADTG